MTSASAAVLASAIAVVAAGRGARPAVAIRSKTLACPPTASMALASITTSSGGRRRQTPDPCLDGLDLGLQGGRNRHGFPLKGPDQEVDSGVRRIWAGGFCADFIEGIGHGGGRGLEGHLHLGALLTETGVEHGESFAQAQHVVREQVIRAAAASAGLGCVRPFRPADQVTMTRKLRTKGRYCGCRIAPISIACADLRRHRRGPRPCRCARPSRCRMECLCRGSRH